MYLAQLCYIHIVTQPVSITLFSLEMNPWSHAWQDFALSSEPHFQSQDLITLAEHTWLPAACLCCRFTPQTALPSLFPLFSPLSGVSPKVLECGEEKILALTEVERFKALAAQFVKLLRSQKDNCLMMTDLLTEYTKTFGYTFRLQDYDAKSFSALLQKLCHVKVAYMELGKQIQLINLKSLHSLMAQLLVLLMSWEDA